MQDICLYMNGCVPDGIK